MKIIVTTSNNYKHLIPIFIYLFNKNWGTGHQVELVGYDKSDFQLPFNFTFHSLGEQKGGPQNFSTDLRKYFELQDKWFVWMMEDTFIKSVDHACLNDLKFLTQVPIPNLGRINLCSRATFIQTHITVGDKAFENFPYQLFENTQTALYRLCTQPSIWNRDFLLKYLTPNLTPWQFETQESINDGWRIFGISQDVVNHNEGVTKHDLRDYNLNGIKEEQIIEMKKLNIL